MVNMGTNYKAMVGPMWPGCVNVSLETELELLVLYSTVYAKVFFVEVTKPGPEGCVSLLPHSLVWDFLNTEGVLRQKGKRLMSVLTYCKFINVHGN